MKERQCSRLEGKAQCRLSTRKLRFFSSPKSHNGRRYRQRISSNRTRIWVWRRARPFSRRKRARWPSTSTRCRRRSWESWTWTATSMNIGRTKWIERQSRNWLKSRRMPFSWERKKCKRESSDGYACQLSRIVAWDCTKSTNQRWQTMKNLSNKIKWLEESKAHFCSFWIKSRAQSTNKRILKELMISINISKLIRKKRVLKLSVSLSKWDEKYW